MRTVQILPADLAALMSGGPALILGEELAGAEPAAPDGLGAFLARRLPGGDVWLHRPGTAPDPAALSPLPWPPADILAVVESDAARLEAWQGWWEEAGQAPPPRILADSLTAALPELMAALARALLGVNDRAVTLQRSLVALRQDHEALREAHGALTRRLAHQPEAAPRLVLATEPGPHRLAAGGAPFRLRQRLGVALDGLARLALHVAEADPEAVGEALLRLRLIGAESGRVQGAWTLALRGLAPGWLVLDLPTPLGALGEGAVLELQAEAAPAGGFALSLDAGWTEDSAALQAEGAAAPGEHALALRLWTGEPGSRFLAPAHWRWDAPGLALPEAGVPHAVPESSWAAARALSGEASLIGLGEEMPRALLRAGGSGPALLHLPYLHGAGLDLLRLGAVLRQGSAADLRLGLWLLPLDRRLEQASDLAPRADGGSWSGWLGFNPDGTLEAALPLPLALGLRFQLVLALAGPDGAAAPAGSAVELTRLALQTAEGAAPLLERAAVDLPQALPPIAPLPVAALPEAGPGPAAAPAPAAAPEAAAAEATAPLPATTLQPVATLEAVMLNQYRPPPPQDAQGYRHLDMTIMSLGVGETRWPGVRFKLSLSGEQPRLEFRQAQGHPEAFSRWLGQGEDKFGPFLRLGLAELPAQLAREDAEPRDTLLLRTLLRLLPGATANAARAAGLLPEEMGQWLEAARLLAAQASLGEPGADAPGAPPEEAEKLLLNQHYAGTGDYRHLDITVLNLRGDPAEGMEGEAAWPMVRLKLGRTSRSESIEFRQSQGWPQAFEEWTETGFDRFGPFIRLTAENLASYREALAAPRDRALLAVLLQRLPGLTRAAAAEAGLDEAAQADWAAAAERLAVALAGTAAPAAG
ncbi:DUF6212 domain-containing protein [Pseudoroseomonas cervicalis]|uniref:DUF6212 domain-containing protein n=1 Tax=Teichococcus cervicalis TaxID=204525 RepID=UPI00278249C8|nr:DUF6212 domain-containing protein [Pseudoroseomonas cervicalis]MDQ1077673.1 hypothetical protein [Pseudoroseomonas cervicalis]